MSLATEIAAQCAERVTEYDAQLSALIARPILVLEDAGEIADGIAEAKACATLYLKFARIAKSMIDAPARGITDMEIKLEMMTVLVSLAVEGADDRWSGRGNDLARTANDARQKQISRIQSMII